MQEFTDDELGKLGVAAGVVWRHLAEGGPVTLAQLTEGTGLSRELALGAIGWLAREGKLRYWRRGRTKVVGLAEADVAWRGAA